MTTTWRTWGGADAGHAEARKGTSALGPEGRAVGGFYAKCDRCGGEVRAARSGPPGAPRTPRAGCGSRGSAAGCRSAGRRAAAGVPARAPRARPRAAGNARPGRSRSRRRPSARGVRVAEVGLHRQLAVENGVAGELAAAVEGDRPAGVLGQAPDGVGDTADHRRRAL